jgi:hypothetical protein
MPAIFFHWIVLHFTLKSVGIFFVASPIISKLLTIARFKVSSVIKLENSRFSVTEIMEDLHPEYVGGIFQAL